MDGVFGLSGKKRLPVRCVLPMEYCAVRQIWNVGCNGFQCTLLEIIIQYVMSKFLRIANDRWLQRIMAVQAILVILWIVLEPHGTAESVYGWICLVCVLCFAVRLIGLLVTHASPSEREPRSVRLRRARFYAAFEVLWLLALLMVLVWRWLC